MKLLLVTNCPADRQESMLRFGAMLAAGLPAWGIETIVTAPALRLARLAGEYRYNGWRKYLGYFDKFCLFPRHLRREIARHRPDAIHIVDQGNSVYAPAAGGRPLVATCHDVLQIRAARDEFPQHHTSANGRRYQALVLRHLAAVPCVACVSEQTRVDLLRLAPRDGRITRVIQPGLNHPYAPVPEAEARAVVGPLLAAGEKFPRYFLNVGGGQWYKNRAGLLAIFAELVRRTPPAPPLLVLVGKPLSAADAALAVELGVAPHLRQLPGVANATLAALYALAEGLIFPSWQEGFGWPIAEAQACGCPVFTTGRAPMTEAGGDAAVYFDPAAPADAAQRILGADRAGLRAAGLARAGRWSAPRMLGEYAALYHEACGQPHAAAHH